MGAIRSWSAGERGQEALRAILRRVPPGLPRRPLLQPDRPRRRGRDARPLSSGGREPRPVDARGARAEEARPPLGRAWYVSQEAFKVEVGYVQFMEYTTQDSDPNLFKPLAGRSPRGPPPSGSGWWRPSRSTWTRSSSSPSVPIAARSRPRSEATCEPLRQAPEAGPRSRRGLPADPGTRPRLPLVPLPRRAVRRRRRSAARLRLGARQPAQLLPLVVDARRRAAAAGGRGQAPRPEVMAAQVRRMLGDRRPGAGHRVRLPVARDPRLRPAQREERAGLPRVPRPCAARCTRRPSGSSSTSSVATAPCSTCSTPTTRSSTRPSRSSTASPASPDPTGGGSTGSRRRPAAGSWGWRRSSRSSREPRAPAPSSGATGCSRCSWARSCPSRPRTCRSCPRASSTPAA